MRPARMRRRRRSGSGSQGFPRLGGGVSGSPSHRSPRALATVLRSPAGDTAYAPPCPLPPPLDHRRRPSPAARAARGRQAAGASSRCSTKAVAPLWERLCPIAKRCPSA
ncbi:hypothetical protein SORBI_3003G244500 [Sorghum bicolor]|uniref:Uncharacterized protein n=1 Tax=Sorghum bicolor TaxID=4558 RepID=A0A1B6Q532_SORBI|nr:hypothetical protein SORBI_3003G244500 [Sorghum bicolor]